MQTVGQRIAERRKELGLSQERLAKRAGLSRRWLIEAEQCPDLDPSLRISMIRGIARALGVSIGWLCDGDEDMAA